MLELLKVPFLVLHFFCYLLKTFMMVLSVTFLSMLMILLSILSVIRHLISGNNLKWLRDTVDWGRKCLVDVNAQKTQLDSFDQSNITGVDFLF